MSLSNYSQQTGHRRDALPTVLRVNCIEAVAAYLATEPESVHRALRIHRPAADGRCTTCRGAARWPCAVAAGAQLALETLQDTGAPGGPSLRPRQEPVRSG